VSGLHGDYSPTGPAAPFLRPLILSGSLIRCESVQVYHHHLCSFPRAVLWTSLRFRGGRPLHSVQSVASRNPVEDPTIRFLISSSMVFLKIQPDGLYFLRNSCHLAPRLLKMLLHSGPFRHTFLTICLLWMCPLCCAGTAWWVICRQVAASIFRDPPSPLVRFFGCRRCPMARCQFPCRSSSALVVSTVASSLGTSECSTTVSDFSRLASNFLA
jgi:hypothetical protein